MKEYVGDCSQCGKEIHCMDGFLNGVATEGGALYCFECCSDLLPPPSDRAKGTSSVE